MTLKVHPEFRSHVEVDSEAQRSIGSNRTLSLHNVVDASNRHIELTSQFALADLQRSEKFLKQNFAGRNGFQFARQRINGSSV